MSSFLKGANKLCLKISIHFLIVNMIAILTATSESYADCGEKEIPVRAHNRVAEGRVIRVQAHCRRLSNDEAQWWELIRMEESDFPLKNQTVPHAARVAVLKVVGELPRWSKFVGRVNLVISTKAPTSSVNLITREIVIQEKALKSATELRRVIVHELAHLNFFNLKLADRQTFMDITGWVNIDGKDKLFPRERILTEDSVTGVEEHFANSVELYATQSGTMKIQNPGIYKFLQEKLGE